MRKEATSCGHMWTEATVWTRMFLASWTPLDMLIGQTCGQYGQNCGQHSLVRCAELQTYQVSMDKSACKYFADKNMRNFAARIMTTYLLTSHFPCTIIAMRCACCHHMNEYLHLQYHATVRVAIMSGCCAARPEGPTKLLVSLTCPVPEVALLLDP